jgi:N-methylhydantoinase A
MAQWSVGIDTGGTFTDLAAVDHGSGETFITKVPSTPQSPADAILEALKQFSGATRVPLGELALLAHGTTVATNAVIEGKGAKAGLLITAGYRAVYLGRSGTRPLGANMIDPGYRKAAPLVPLWLTCEIPERIGFDGKVIQPLDREAVRVAANRLKAESCNSIAIVFLFSFLRDDHERQAAEIVRAEFPDARLSLSSEVLPVIREFPRMSTTALDAYVGPVVSTYFTKLGERARDRGINLDRLFIMQSNGGLMRVNLAAAYPNETLLSGPAAGIAFATTLGQHGRYSDLVTFDMGGTSTDMCLVRGGRAPMVNSGVIAGQEIGTSMIEIRTIGAGGGAIAYKGDDGLLKVGPRSAGARPGPACYARGGTEPTVTDANVMLGYLDTERFLGGALKGNQQLAEEALTTLGAEFGMGAVEAAIGVRRVINARMASALRLNLTDKGCDPREFGLLAFGGCGPLHAVELAVELGLRRVIVPAFPGVSCAMGLLQTDVKHVYLRSMPQDLSTASSEQLNAGFESLEAKAREDAVREGFGAGAAKMQRQLDVRYARQGYQLTIDAPAHIEERDLALLRLTFDQVHESTYGVSAPDEGAEIVTIRLMSLVNLPRMPLASRSLGQSHTGAKPIGTRPAWFAATSNLVNTSVYSREMLTPGTRLTGPLIVEQLDSTTVIEPGRVVEVDDIGNLVIETMQCR